MAGLKDAFSKGITTLNVKTNNFMEQNKINTYISNLEKEVRELKLLAGSTMYDQWRNGESDLSRVQETFQLINQKDSEIQQQRYKLEQIKLEEERILNNQSQQTPGQVYCGQCGAQNADNYKFCVKCGTPLQ